MFAMTSNYFDVANSETRIETIIRFSYELYSLSSIGHLSRYRSVITLSKGMRINGFFEKCLSV